MAKSHKRKPKPPGPVDIRHGKEKELVELTQIALGMQGEYSVNLDGVMIAAHGMDDAELDNRIIKMRRMADGK